MALLLTWASIGALALITVVMLFFGRTARYQERLVLRFWQRIGLPLETDQIAGAVRRRISHRSTAQSTGTLVGLLVSALALILNPSLASLTFMWLFALPAVLTCMAAGDLVLSLRSSLFRRHPDAARLARSSATTLRDYVSGWRLHLAPVFILISGALCGCGVALGALGAIDLRHFVLSTAFPLLALSILVLLAGMAMERRILRRSQPAADTLELAWDDAFRAETFRALRLFETIVAWLALAASGIGILQGIDALAGTVWSTGLGPQLLIWGYLATLGVFSVGRAQTQFRYALWPDLAKVEVGTGR